MSFILMFLMLFSTPKNNLPQYDLATSVDALYFAYNVDHEKADKTYYNKRVLVIGKYGRVLPLDRRRDNLMTLTTCYDRMKYAIAILNKTSVPKAEKYYNGKMVVLLCTVEHASVDDVDHHTTPWLLDCDAIR